MLFFVKTLNRKSQSYKEYIFLLNHLKEISKDVHKEKIVSIRLKLILSFMLIFMLIITFFSITLMNNYKISILKSVNYNGKIFSEQSASSFKENFNDSININFYLNKQNENNKDAELKFNSISLYKKQGKDNRFKIENSTDKKMIGYELATDQAIETYRTNPMIHDTIYKQFIHITPIIMQAKLIGFSVVTYKEDVIYEPYFRTQVKIVFFTFIFLYLALILVYLLGSRISLPILFLRMNVKKLSTNLEKIMSGKEKVSLGDLVYNDLVTSKDEIKGLSTEISNMVTVIKGIIPYVSASTLKSVDKSASKSSKKELAFLFTDMRGFTTMCEGMKPDEVVELLNHYLDIQTSVILKNNGDIDKFVGDEIMAVFDGASKEKNACNAALELMQEMEKVTIERKNKNLSVINIGIGINVGQVVFGSVGAKDRRDFTSIGDTVNLAARLEGTNKEYHTKALITEHVCQEISDKFLCREIDLMTVKGKSKPVRIFELLDYKEKTNKKLLNIIKIYEAGLARYRRMDWQGAAELFKKNIKEYDDGPSKVFYKRIQLFMKNPPPNKWNGVFAMLTK